MKNRIYWGMPNTETDVNALETTIGNRARDTAAGKFAAAAFVDEAVERVTRRSGALLQVNTLFAVVSFLLATRAAEQPALYLQLNRWAFIFALVSGLLLVTNLALVWARDVGKTWGDPHEAFAFTMNIYKGRAWRYTLALLLTFAAFALTLFALTQIK
jgi:hypothetical protein